MIIAMKTEKGRTVYGGKAVGLVSYLLGPGRHNEHEGQRVVAGSASVMASHAGQVGEEWTPDAVHAVGHGLERDFRRFDGDRTRGHIFHVSMSLHPSEAAVSDERWEDIARRYVAEMGFVDHESRPDCEWVAARHGAGRSGQDHVHVAVCLVRPDGSRADPRGEQPRAAALAAAFERDYGLRITRDPGAAQAKGSSALGRAELEKAARAERMPDRRWLERAVRAAGTAAEGEAEFVRRLRSGGALVRPYYAAGGRSEVTGYSVARKPTAPGERPIWFGGGRLARDLTLPALRGLWGEEPASRAGAVGEWSRAGRGRAVRDAGAETRVLPETAWAWAADGAAKVNRALESVPVTDRGRWEQTAADAAGVFAAWSARLEGDAGGPLAEASRALAGSAQPAAAGGRPVRRRVASEDALAIPAAVILQAAARRSDVGWLAVMAQLDKTATAIAAAHTARGERVAAGRMLATVNEQVQTVRAGWDAAVEDGEQRAGQAAGATLGDERWRTFDHAAARREQDRRRGHRQDRDYGR